MKIFHKEVFTAVMSKASKPAGIVITIAGVFTDFVKPYLNFVPYFLLVSLLILVVLWIIQSRRPVVEGESTLDGILKSSYSPLFGFAVISFVFWLVMIPVFWMTPQEGILSSSVSNLGELQETLLGRFDKLESKMDNRFDQVLKKLEEMDANAGIVNHPKSYADYYHNARIYELTGNALGARQAFEKYFESNLSFIDPFISYSQIVKSLEGPSSTESILGALRTKYPDNPAVALTYAINKKDNSDQEFLLNKVKESFPDYGPVYFYIFKINTAFADGGQTLTNEERGLEALAKLDTLEKKDGFSKFFINKEILAENNEMIRQARLFMKENEKRMDFEYHIMQNDLVLLSFHPSEMVKKIFYRLDGIGDFMSTGNSNIMIDGAPYPELDANTSLPLGEHKIEIKYIDREGEESPSETFEFEIRQIRISFNDLKWQESPTEVQYHISFNFYKVKHDNTILQYSIDSEKFNTSLEHNFGDEGITISNPTVGKHFIVARLKLANGKFSQVSRLEFEIKP